MKVSKFLLKTLKTLKINPEGTCGSILLEMVPFDLCYFFIFVLSRSWSCYTTRSDIKSEERETKPTLVGYLRFNF